MGKRKAYVVEPWEAGGFAVRPVGTGERAWWSSGRGEAADICACMNFAHERAVRLERARARRAAKRKAGGR